jgi:YVTN family beta-propeller protein
MTSCLPKLAAAILALSLGTSAAWAEPGFAPLPAIDAPTDRWDFASWDAAHQRLLVAHGRDVLVIDPQTRAVRSIGALAHAHGVLPLPGGSLVLATSGQDNTVRILDADTGTETARIAVAADPDAAILSADGTRAYVMDAKAGMVSVIDIAARRETARIALKPGLEVPAIVGTTLAVNNEDESDMEFVDLAGNTAAGTLPLTGCTAPTGLAYDADDGLLLSTCTNGKAALVDPARRRVVALVPIGLGPDTAIWDGANHRFLVPCGKSGTLAIVHIRAGSAPRVTTVPTVANARTAAYDPAGGRLYLPAAALHPDAAGKLQAVAGTFRIAVMAPVTRTNIPHQPAG